MTAKPVSKNRFIGAGISNLVYLGAQTVLFIVLTPLLLHRMGQEIYGVWMLMLSIFGFATIANFGTASTATKYTSQFLGSENAGQKLSVVFTFSYSTMLVISVVACSVLLLLRPWLVENIDIGPLVPASFSQALAVIAVSLLPFFLGLVSRGILLGLVRNGVANSIALITDLMLWSSALFVSVISHDILLLAFCVLASHLVRFVLMSFSAWWFTRKLYLRIAWAPDLTRQMLDYSFTIWLGSLGVVLFKSLDRMVLALTLDVAAVGIYSIGTSIAIRLNSLANNFAQVLMPFASSREAAGRDRQIAETFRRSARFIGTLLAAAVGILVIWMDIILKTWLSQDFAANYTDIFRILVIAYGVYSMYLPAFNVLAGRGWLKFPVFIQIVAGLGTVVAIWRLSIPYGLMGAAYANFVYALVLLIHFYLAIRILKKPIRKSIADLGPPLLIVLVVSLLPLTYPSIYWRIAATFAAMCLVAFSILSSGGNRFLLNLASRRFSGFG